MSYIVSAGFGGGGGAFMSKPVKTIEQKIITVLSDVSGIREDDITLNSHLKDDLNLDSLNKVEVMMGIEDVFSDKFEIPDEEVEGIVIVGALVEYVAGKVEGKEDEKQNNSIKSNT